MFCPNCGTALSSGVNFCPNCGTQVADLRASMQAKGVDQGNMVMIQSLGTCGRATAAALLQQICGYTTDEALLIVDSVPITVARGLNDAQARMLAQAFAEYGLEVSVYDGTGWRELESTSTSVWDQAGSLITSVAAALGLINIENRISRDLMHRWDYPYRYTGARPPVYRLNNALRAVPTRRVAPVRPPVHHAPPPRPTPPPRPAPPPPRPTHAPASHPGAAPAQRPAPRPVHAPAQARPQPRQPGPTTQQRQPGPMPPGGHPGGHPGGRPGGGTGRKG